MKRWSVAAAAMAAAVMGAASAQAQMGAQTGAQTGAKPLRPDQAEFRALYKALVETDTTLSAGSCTEAAAKAGAHLKAAGFPDADLHYFADPAHPKEGGLVAVLPGRDPKARPILLMAHLDVVEARREDWERDPFTLVEEDGFFYARGVADDKADVAIYTDSLARLKRGGAKLKRTVKLALTCGEESVKAFNGMQWLVENRPDLIAAEFAVNEGGGGTISPDGKRLAIEVQVGEKATQNFRLETRNPGGHSSRPTPDNAIYQLSEALLKVRAHRFPIGFNAVSRPNFAALAAAPTTDPQMARALSRLLADPNDAEADRIASADPDINRLLRTTCIATLLEAGHASNALPQRAAGNINCRILPGETLEGTQAALVQAIGDPGVSVTLEPPVRPLAKIAPLDPRVLGTAQRLVDKHFGRGLTLQPVMQAGYTDALWLGQANVPVYGLSGIFFDTDGNGAHGLNERLRVSSLYEGRDFQHELIQALANL